MGMKMWLSAFSGFYSPKYGTAGLDTVSKWLFASRSVIWIISVQAAVISGILAFASGRFDALYFLLVVAGFVIAHAASNLMNDYFGYVRGQDKGDSPRRTYTIHPLASGLVTKSELRNAVALLIVLGLAIASYFTIVRGYLVLLFLFVGAVFLFGYDAFPITLKSIGLGEIYTFIVWGPLMVGGGYFLISGAISTGAFLAGVPYGLGVMSILVGKHMDQANFDRRAGQRTLPVLLGEKNARILNIAIIAAMYLSIVPMAVYGYVSAFSMMVVFNLPNAASAIAALSKPRPKSPPSGYVGWPLWYHRASLKHNKNFGWLYILGLLIGAIIPLIAQL